MPLVDTGNPTRNKLESFLVVALRIGLHWDDNMPGIEMENTAEASQSQGQPQSQSQGQPQSQPQNEPQGQPQGNSPREDSMPEPVGEPRVFNWSSPQRDQPRNGDGRGPEPTRPTTRHSDVPRPEQ